MTLKEMPLPILEWLGKDLGGILVVVADGIARSNFVSDSKATRRRSPV